MYLPLCWGLAVFIAPKYGVSDTRLSELVQISASLKDNVMHGQVKKNHYFYFPLIDKEHIVDNYGLVKTTFICTTSA